MIQKYREKVITLTGSLTTSIIVVFVAFALNAHRDDSKELIIKIDSKVDKLEYQKKCDETDQRITILETKQAEILQKNTETLQEIVKQNATMQTDIAWIKREIDRKPK